MDVRERALHLYLLRALDGVKARRLCSMSGTGSCSRWEYEGEGKQWADVEVERESWRR